MSAIIRFSSFDEAQEHWQRNEKHVYRDLLQSLAFKTQVIDILHDLEALNLTTGDPRFKAAVDALREHGLIEAYRWTAKTPFPEVNNLSQRYEETGVAMVQLLKNEGLSLRLAIAVCVANLGWPGNSFSAAVKAVERLWRASAFNEE